MRPAFPALMLTLAALPAQADAPKPVATCNEFAWQVCFSLDDRDTRTRKPIIDFTIDEIELARGAHVTVYEGVGLAEQDDAGTITTAKSSDTPSGKVEVKIGSKTAPRYFDLHYIPAQGWGVVQIFGYLKDAHQAGLVAEFLAGFHPCKHENLSVSCTADAPFEEAADFIRGLAK